MDYTGNPNNEPKVLDNKKILFMMNNLAHPEYVYRMDNIIGSVRNDSVLSIDVSGEVINISCRDDFETFINNLEAFKENGIERYENFKIIVQTTDLSSMSFSLIERFGFQIFIGRWFKDSNNEFVLNVLEIKPHMNEIPKDLKFEHNISKLCVAHVFDDALSKLTPIENRLNELTKFRQSINNNVQYVIERLICRKYQYLGG